MSLPWVIMGTFIQVVLAIFLFVLVAFSAGGIDNLKQPGRLRATILDVSLYVLPVLCLVSAAIVIYEYTTGGSTASYWWYCLPGAVALIYAVYARRLKK